MCHMRTIGRMARLGVLLGAMVVSLATPATAALDIVMNVDGVTGENCFDGAHEGWICVLATSFAGDRQCQPDGPGRSCTVPTFTDFNVSKIYDSSSPQLLNMLLRSEPIPRVEIEWWQTGEKPIQTAEVLLENVAVTNISASGGSGGDQFESVSFTFGKITSTVWPIKPDGTQGPPQTACWDAVKAGPC